MSDLGKVTVDIIIKELNSEDYFIGGSRRFGYFRPESDWDLFVLLAPDKHQATRLVRSGFVKETTRPPEEQYAPGILYNFHDFIHVLLMDDYFKFKALKEEHEKVEKFLQKRPAMVTFIKQMRSSENVSLPGREIYRALLRAARQHGYLEP